MLMVGAWICLLYLAFRVLQYGFSTPSISPSTLLSCDSARDRISQSITIPKPPNKKLLSNTWKTLQTSFDQNKPQPLNLHLKTFSSIAEYPSLEEIQTHTPLSRADAEASHDSHITIVKNLPSYPKSLYKGRGIVILAGGKYSSFAATGMGMLREVGSALPVEVWMKDEHEEKAGWCKDIEQDGMVCRRLSDYMDVASLQHGYQLKINSILFSSFEQVLFLDADNVPVKNPDPVFEAKTFKDTGIVLWPDYWKHTGSPLLPYEVGLAEEASEMLRQDQTAESGQLVWDKKRHWKVSMFLTLKSRSVLGCAEAKSLTQALCLTAYYNYYGPTHYYTLISQGWAGWGDKDTFPVALRSLQQDYYMVPHKLKTLFVNGTDHGIGMLQADPTNTEKFQPMFLHSNIIKWSIRDFLCIKCDKDKEPVLKSFLEKSDSAINPHLKDHERIFNGDDMQAMGIDPEPLIWKSMEHTACRSVWKDEELCTRTRKHMAETFGHRFVPPGMMADMLGYGDNLCIMDKL